MTLELDKKDAKEFKVVQTNYQLFFCENLQYQTQESLEGLQRLLRYIDSKSYKLVTSTSSEHRVRHCYAK